MIKDIATKASQLAIKEVYFLFFIVQNYVIYFKKTNLLTYIF